MCYFYLSNNFFFFCIQTARWPKKYTFLLEKPTWFGSAGKDSFLKFFFCFNFQPSYSIFPFLGIYGLSWLPPAMTLCPDNQSNPTLYSFLIPWHLFPGVYFRSVVWRLFFPLHTVLLLKIFLCDSTNIKAVHFVFPIITYTSNSLCNFPVQFSRDGT